MKKYLKWIGIGIGSLIGLTLVFLLVVTLLFGGKVERAFINQVNKQLSTELTASKVKLNLFSSFPSAKLTFRDIRIDGQPLNSGKEVLVAEELIFRFNVWDILSGRYNVKRVEANRGTLQMHRYANGNSNFDIFKSTDAQSGDSTEVNLNVRTVLLEDMQVRYVDERSSQDMRFTVLGGRVSGNVADSPTRLRGRLGVVVDSIAGTQYFSAKPATLDFILDADFERSLFAFTDSRIVIEDDSYVLDGSISQTDIDLNIAGDELSVSSFLAMVPIQNETFQSFESAGDLSFNATIQGSLEAMPAVDFKFEMNDGTIAHPDLATKMADVNLAGSFALAEGEDWENASLLLDPFEGTISKEPFDCTVKLTNLNQPKLELALNATLDLADWNDLLISEAARDFMGSLTFEDVRISAEPSEGKWNKLTSSGNLTLGDVGFGYLNKDIAQLTTELDLSNNQLRFDQLDVTIDGMLFELKGQLANGLQWSLANLFGTNDQPLQMHITALVDRLDLDELLYVEYPVATEAKEDFSPETTSTSEHYRLLNMFDGTISLTADQFNFREFDADELLAELQFAPGSIEFAPCSATTLDGRIALSGEAKRFGNSLQIDGSVRGRNIDIKQLFASCENFGQQALSAENLSGTGNTEFTFTTRWDTNMVFLDDLLTVSGDIDILNGELISFEPMKELSAFAKLKELEHVEFDRLKNQIEIRDERVIIPAMLIRSTALNLIMGGNHYFDDRIEYYFKVNLLDVLARKFRFGKAKLNEVDDVSEGLINLYVAMTGTVDDPVIKTDKKLVIERLRLDEHDPTDVPHEWRPESDTLEFIPWDTP